MVRPNSSNTLILPVSVVTTGRSDDVGGLSDDVGGLSGVVGGLSGIAALSGMVGRSGTVGMLVDEGRDRIVGGIEGDGVSGGGVVSGSTLVRATGDAGIFGSGL